MATASLFAGNGNYKYKNAGIEGLTIFIFENVQQILKNARDSKRFKKSLKDYKWLQTISSDFKIFSNVRDYVKKSQKVSNGFKRFQKIS